MNKGNSSNQMIPLLRRTRLLPGESLPSLLERLVQRNYYPHVRTLAHIGSASTDRDNLAYPSRIETFIQIAQLTGIAPDELFNASQQRFAPLLTPRHQTPMQMGWIGGASKIILSPIVAKNHLHPASVAHYCPLCLKISAYHHLNWVPIATTVCLEHLCLLVNACPQCGKHLSVSEVVKRRCGACWANLCAAQVIPVADDALGICAQRMVQNWLWDSSLDPEWSTGSGFPATSPIQLYHLLENLFWQLLTCYREWPLLPPPFDGLAEHIPSPTRRLHYLSPKQIYCLYRVAFTGLMNWPMGLFQVLDACSGYFIPALSVSIRLKRLEMIQSEWCQPAWQEGETDFLQKAFADYLLARNLPLLS
jgi:hypothetical protein